MTRNEKKTAIENMAERFMSISDLEGKSMAIMVMSAYAEGKAAGKVEDHDCGIDDGVVLDDSEYQRAGAAGDDTCGNGAESGNNRADGRDRKQIQGFRWYVRGLGER